MLESIQGTVHGFAHYRMEQMPLLGGRYIALASDRPQDELQTRKRKLS